MKTYIVNAKVVFENYIEDGSYLEITDGKITGIGTGMPKIESDDKVIDAEGLYVGPGLVDIHVHGYGDCYIYENAAKNVEHFLSHGETTFLSGLYFQLSKEEFLDAIEYVKEARKDEKIGRVLEGFYMEGPYMNPKYGAMAELNKWKKDINPDDYTEIVDKAGDLVKVWVVAPERKDVDKFLTYAKGRNPGAVVSVGHSEATPEQVYSLEKFGLRLQTHCMNATGRLPTLAGTRSCGPDEACMYNKDMYAEIICDSLGLHVHPDMLRLILSIKGSEKIILITDSFPEQQPNPEELSYVKDLCFDANGGLCGSKLTLDTACKNMMKHTGCGILDVFRMASINPARAIGMDNEIGSVSLGKRANLIFVDSSFELKKVLLDGEQVK